MRIVFLTLFSVFHLVMKHCVSRLMYYVTIKHLFIKTREAPHFRQYYCIFSFQLEIVERTYENKTVPFDFWNEKENDVSVQTKSMVLSFSFASADKCASWSNYQLNYLPQWAEILTQRSNLTPPRASEKYFDLHVVYLSCKAGLLRTFPLFSSETSKLESRCSLLRIEVFLPGFSLLLNAQRNLHEGEFN